MGNIYDGAFRTILNDCRQMIIPVINEVFKEDYTGNEIIEFIIGTSYSTVPPGVFITYRILSGVFL